MQRLILALILCAALAGSSIWSLRAVDRTTEAVIAEIEAGQLTQAYATWENAQALLGSLLLHEEIDQADRLFARVLTAASAGGETDFVLDRAELLSQLHHLAGLQRPSLKNLF